MTTIFWKPLTNGNCVSIDETRDADYARQCFDGSDREWKEVLDEAIRETSDATGTDSPTFYIVSPGLSGLYMRDNVSVFGCKTDALQLAKDEIQRDKDESQDCEDSENAEESDGDTADGVQR